MRQIFRILACVHLLLPLTATAEPELGSEAYILSHFHYAQVARVNQMQRETLPGGERVRPCSAEVLPASPSQMTKKYYVDAVVRFGTQALHTEGRSPPALPTMSKEGISTEGNYCRRMNPNSPTINPATGTRWCLMARDGRFVVMSDVYHDSCGNYFRGVWETATVMDAYVHGRPTLTSPEEHAVTTSVGRYDGMSPDPQFSGAMNFIPGPTGSVNVSRFLYFVRATDEDMMAVNNVIAQQLAPRGSYRRCGDGTFQLQGCPR